MKQVFEGCYSMPIAPALLLLALTTSGCGHTASPSNLPHRAIAPESLRVVSGAELESLVQESARPVLVEFGVNFGCDRCNRMQPEMARLARDFDDRADVVRVDFNANRQLAAQFGATICPSYVLIHQGSVTATRSFPTSADFLAADLDSILRNDDERSMR